MAATLHRINQPADVGGVHALQGYDLAGDAMHGDTHAVYVEPDVLEVRLNIEARNTAEISGSVKRRNPLHVPSERLSVEHTTADAAEFKKAFETNLIVAFASSEAQRCHDPKWMRGYRLREDMTDIDNMLDGVEPQSARQTYRHWGKREAANVVGKCWPAVEAVAAAC